MYSIRDEAHGDLRLWPSREKRLKDVPADFSMKFADSAHLAAAAKSKVSHVERLALIIRFLPSHRKQFVRRDSQFLLRIVFEIFPAEFRVEAIESCWYSRMSCK
jgi:hypothetical protein